MAHSKVLLDNVLHTAVLRTSWHHYDMLNTDLAFDTAE